MTAFATLSAAVVSVAAATAIAQPFPGHGQQQSTPPPTFRSATALVEVDIIVKDKDGRFVSGLTSEDFEVLEEGRPQQIQHFYLVTEHASAPGAPQSTVMVPRSPDQTERRAFVLYFDTDHLSATGLARLKQAAMTFVGARFGPRDLGGVFANGALWHGHLTSDAQELLDGIRGVMPAIETSATRRARLVEFPRIDSELDAVRIEAGDQHLLDTVAAQNCVRERANCDMEGGAEYVVVKLQRKAQTYVAEARQAAAATLRTLAYMSKNLAGLEGRKTLVMISEGFFTHDARSELPLIAGQASRAGVTIYTLDARGTSGTGGRTIADASVSLGSLSMDGDSAEEGLDILASETGGLPLRHTDDFAAAMASVADDTSTYYVLAYSPDNAVLDGRYRTIQLRTTWKGLSVRARRGYVATPLPRPKSVRIGG
jgi:VWFA-related protein